MCVVETTKAAIEVESPGDGTLLQLCRPGDEVDLGGRVALVAESDADLGAIDRQAERPPPEERQSAPNATRKALELADEHGIDLASIEKEGFITAEDVEALVAGLGQPAAPAGDPLLAGASVDNVSLPEHFGVDGDVGRLDEAFLASLRADPDAFRALSSEERVAAYRENGARIGDGVEPRSPDADRGAAGHPRRRREVRRRLLRRL